MPGALRVWTREEVLALPDDGNRYELIAGELLVSPSPRAIHQFAIMRLYDRLSPYVRANGIGFTMLAPADLDLRSGDLIQPDLFVVPSDPQGRQPIEWSEFATPILIAEVTSPSTARHDRITKRRRYQRARVSNYWIVDADARVIERWAPEDERPEVLDERITWSPLRAGEPLVIDLGEFFREVWGEV